MLKNQRSRSQVLHLCMFYIIGSRDFSIISFFFKSDIAHILLLLVRLKKKKIRVNFLLVFLWYDSISDDVVPQLAVNF